VNLFTEVPAYSSKTASDGCHNEIANGKNKKMKNETIVSMINHANKVGAQENSLALSPVKSVGRSEVMVASLKNGNNERKYHYYIADSSKQPIFFYAIVIINENEPHMVSLEEYRGKGLVFDLFNKVILPDFFDREKGCIEVSMIAQNTRLQNYYIENSSFFKTPPSYDGYPSVMVKRESYPMKINHPDILKDRKSLIDTHFKAGEIAPTEYLTIALNEVSTPLSDGKIITSFLVGRRDCSHLNEAMKEDPGCFRLNKDIFDSLQSRYLETPWEYDLSKIDVIPLLDFDIHEKEFIFEGADILSGLLKIQSSGTGRIRYTQKGREVIIVDSSKSEIKVEKNFLENYCSRTGVCLIIDSIGYRYIPISEVKVNVKTLLGNLTVTPKKALQLSLGYEFTKVNNSLLIRRYESNLFGYTSESEIEKGQLKIKKD